MLSERSFLDLIAICREHGVELPESEIRAAAVNYLERVGTVAATGGAPPGS